MTVEDMIEELTSSVCPFFILKSNADRIIAALKAGQALATRTDVVKEKLWQAGYERDCEELDNCLRAWDAATQK